MLHSLKRNDAKALTAQKFTIVRSYTDMPVRTALKKDGDTCVIAAVYTAGEQQEKQWAYVRIEDIFPRPASGQNDGCYYMITSSMIPEPRVLQDKGIAIGLSSKPGENQEIIKVKRISIPQQYTINDVVTRIFTKQSAATAEDYKRFYEWYAAASAPQFTGQMRSMLETALNTIKVIPQQRLVIERLMFFLEHQYDVPVRIYQTAALVEFVMDPLKFRENIRARFQQFQSEPDVMQRMGRQTLHEETLNLWLASNLSWYPEIGLDLWLASENSLEILSLILSGGYERRDVFENYLAGALRQRNRAQLFQTIEAAHALETIAALKERSKAQLAAEPKRYDELAARAFWLDYLAYSLLSIVPDMETDLVSVDWNAETTKAAKEKYYRDRAVVSRKLAKYYSTTLNPNVYKEEAGYMQPGQGYDSPDWLIRETVMRAVFELQVVQGSTVSKEAVAAWTGEHLRRVHGFWLSEEELARRAGAVIDNLNLEETDAPAFAMETRNWQWIKGRLAVLLDELETEGGSDALRTFLAACAEHATTGERLFYPVDAQYPLLWALFNLSEQRQAALEGFFDGLEAQGDRLVINPAIDSMRIALVRRQPDGKINEHWMKKHAPDLAGRDVFISTAEFIPPKGGLARVLLAHNFPKTALHGDSSTVHVIAPLYRMNFVTKKKNTLRDYLEMFLPYVDTDRHEALRAMVLDGVQIPDSRDDYIANLARQIRKISAGEAVRTVEIDRYGHTAVMNVFDVDLMVEGRILKLHLWQHDISRDQTGIDLTEMIYDYSWPGNGKPTWDDFSVAMNKCAIEIIAAESEQSMHQKGSSYKPPVVHFEDAQSTLGPVFWLVEYKKALAKQDRGEVLNFRERLILESHVLQKIHTIRNVMKRGDRGAIDGLIDTGNLPIVFEAGLTRRFYYDLFLSQPDNQWDHTRAGAAAIRLLKGTLACVAKVHRTVLRFKNGYDDFANMLVATTNGDTIYLSARHLAERFKDIDAGIKIKDAPGDPIGTDFTPEQLMRAKAAARHKVNETLDVISRDQHRKGTVHGSINEHMPIAAFTGRGVSIKTGIKGSDHIDREFFTLDTLREVLKTTNVVYYINSAGDSGEVFNKLKAYREKLVGDKLPGQLVIVYGFNHEEQLELLAATDVVLNPSAHWTGASEISEQDGMICGASVMAWPWEEGSMYAVLGPDHSVVPAQHNPQAVVHALNHYLSLFYADPEAYARRQMEIMRLARVMDGVFTAKAEIELIERTMRKHQAHEVRELALSA